MAQRQSAFRPTRRWIVGVYLALLALVVPWYWPSDDVRHVLGLPIWALVTLGALFLTSSFTAWVYLTRSDDRDA